MDATYIVWFHSIGLRKDGIQSKRIEARTFLAVEDWAFDNVPDGYELRSIEKHYGTPSELALLNGAVDVTLS